MQLISILSTVCNIIHFNEKCCLEQHWNKPGNNIRSMRRSHLYYSLRVAALGAGIVAVPDCRYNQHPMLSPISFLRKRITAATEYIE